MPKPDPLAITDLLKRYMLREGVTQRTLAVQLEIPETRMSAIMNDRLFPTADHLVTLMRLGVASGEELILAQSAWKKGTNRPLVKAARAAIEGLGTSLKEAPTAAAARANKWRREVFSTPGKQGFFGSINRLAAAIRSATLLGQ